MASTVSGSTEENTRRRVLIILVAVGAAVLALDLFTKQLALAYLASAEPVKLLGGAVYLTLTHNGGAAGGVGSGYTFVFPVIALAVIVGLGYFARMRLRSTPFAVAFGLVMGGAAGNLVDRVVRPPKPLWGHVVDFVSPFAPGGVFPTYIFNLADAALTFGALLAIYLELTGRRLDGGEAGRKGSGLTESANGGAADGGARLSS